MTMIGLKHVVLWTKNMAGGRTGGGGAVIVGPKEITLVSRTILKLLGVYCCKIGH